jgi:hypothetical protein
MKLENFWLVLAFCFVSLDELDRTLTIIEVQARTPPKQAPNTGGSERSRMWYEPASVLENSTEIKASANRYNVNFIF